MTERACTVAGCDRAVRARGWCGAHYMSWSRTGDPLAAKPRPADPDERFDEQTRQSGECLVWIGSTNGKGYGHLMVDGVMKRAHRYAWERANGPIPDGVMVDHLCWERACVKVEHLRLATRSENARYLRGARVTNRSTGVRGVYPDRARFRVQVTKDGVNYGGCHSSVEEAAVEAEALRLELFGAYAGPTPYLAAFETVGLTPTNPEKEN